MLIRSSDAKTMQDGCLDSNFDFIFSKETVFMTSHREGDDIISSKKQEENLKIVHKMLNFEF